MDVSQSFKVGSELLRTLLSQIDLITTLSTAIIGGLIALFIQIAMKNNDPKYPSLQIMLFSLIPIALVCEIISLIFGYFAFGTVTGASPIWLQHQWEAVTLAKQEVNFNLQIRITMMLQLLFFVLGVIFVSIVVIRNLGLVATKGKCNENT